MADFWALVERHEGKIARELICAGEIVAAIYNVNRAAGRQPIGAKDVFPVLGRPESLPREATPEELNMMFEGIKRNFEKGRAVSG